MTDNPIAKKEAAERAAASCRALDEWTANARELVPALAAENAALREDNERLRAALEIASSRAEQWADDDDLSDWAKPARIIAKDIEAALKGDANG